jgi:hypothetical protein
MSRKVNGKIVICTGCECTKPRTDYYKNSRANGVNQPCKECYKQIWISKRYPKETEYYSPNKFKRFYS